MGSGALHAAIGASPGSANLPGVLLAVGLLIGTVVVLSVVLMAMRRRMLSSDRQSSEMGVFEELRRLHRAGELTDEEFEQARRRIIDRVKGDAGSGSSRAE